MDELKIVLTELKLIAKGTSNEAAIWLFDQILNIVQESLEKRQILNMTKEK
jgi:hypothetical protein